MDLWMISNVALSGSEGTYSLSIADGNLIRIDSEEFSTDPAWLAIPTLANMHAHLDRAYTAPPTRPSSLREAVEFSAAQRASFTTDDVFQRGSRLLARSLAHGVTRIRNHTDVDPLVEMRSMEAILRAKAVFAGKIDIEVVAFSTSMNDLLEPGGPARVREAVAMGADLIGAGLNLSRDPIRSLNVVLDLAEELDRPVDIHLDEHLSPELSLTQTLIEAVRVRSLAGRVTLSHGCVLSALEPKKSISLVDGIAQAGISVVALPETNLFLQDRGRGTPRARGVTLARELIAAGVPVRLGTDNVRDWFFPFGDGDMLATGLFAALVAHIDEPRDLVTALCDGRAGLAAGDAADLVLVPADSLDDAIARRPSGRVTMRGGSILSGVLSS